MESVAAFGLAANVLQIVELARKLLSTSYEVYQAGTTVEISELDILTKDFTLLNTRLISWARPMPDTHGPLAEDDQNLEVLAKESDKIAQELITTLMNLKSTGKITRYNSFLQAIKTVWNSDKIKEMKRRLDAIQAAIQFRIQILIREDQIRSKDEILQSLDEASRSIILASMRDRDESLKRQQASDALASVRHDQMVDLITKKWTLHEGSGINDVILRIKAQLRYRRQNDRHDDIVEAHQTTFQWIFQDNSTSKTTSPDLQNWLRNGQGIYWISGKAGSGKSTLMKYLLQEPNLKKHLKSWANGVPLRVLSFYFWNAGSDMQKSQEGLFRSICFQILDQDASFGEVLFPEQFLPGAIWHEFPTFHELRRAFLRFRQSLDGKTKVVMLIDGLDEFDEISLTMTELAELFIAATRSSHMKAILASRPLAPFEFAFKQYPKLRLHELTRNDITAYVNDKLALHPRVSELSAEDARGVQMLSKDIVDAAAGVFLWVKLVVRSLLEGLQDYDRLPDLQKRLQVLPRDLEALFSHMLHKIPVDHNLESSKLFQMVVSHYKNTDFALSALTLGLTDEAYAHVLPTGTSVMSESAKVYIEEQVAGRIRSRCAGLLEIKMREAHSWRPAIDIYEIPTVPCVDFLHRSVTDFLSREDIWTDMLRYTQGTNFITETSLLQAAVQRVKYSESDLGSGALLWWNLEHAMAYARSAEMSTKSASPQLMDQLDAHMTEHFASIKSPALLEELLVFADGRVTTWYDCAGYYEGQKQHDAHRHNSFMSFVISHGLAFYIEAKFTEIGSKGLQAMGRPLLDCACLVDSVDFSPSAQVKIIECLLKYGADPMEKWGYSGETVWGRALPSITGNPFKLVNIAKLFVQYGADLNIRFRDQRISEGVMWSAISYIKRRLEFVTENPSSENYDFEWYKHPDYHRGVSLPARTSTEAKIAFEDLIQYMIAHGARDEDYQEEDTGGQNEDTNGQNEESDCFYTIDGSPNSRQEKSDKYVQTKSKRSQRTRNPIRRLFQRMKS